MSGNGGVPPKFSEACVGQYIFTMNASATAMSVGDTPEGERIDVQYTTGTRAFTDVEAWKRDWSAFGRPETVHGKALALFKESHLSLDQFRIKLGRTVANLQSERRGSGNNDSHKKPADEQDAGRFGDLAQLIVGANGAIAVPDTNGGAEAFGDPHVPWLGFDATLVSGSDWVLARSDGLAEMSGRFAFQSTDEPDHALITMAFSGSMEFGSLRDPASSREAQLLSSMQGTGLPLVAAATFDAGRTAPSWAPDRMKRQAAGFWKYERLTRGEFLALGTANVPAPPTAATFTINVVAHIFEVRTNRQRASVGEQRRP
jgi:hypothetical protein